MSDSYYRFFPGDYHRDTGDLTMIEHGAYRLLLDHYYMKESLPSDLERLYRICGAFSEEERTAVGTVVERFFKSNGKNLLNRKTEEELTKRRSFIETQREKGRKSAKSRAEKKMAQEDDSTGVGTGVKPGLEPGYQPEGQPNFNQPSPSPLKDKEEKQRASSVPPPVDNSNGLKKELQGLVLKISKEYTPRQAREVQLFLELNHKRNPDAICHCLRRLIEEKARGSPPSAVGKWLEAVMRDEDKNYNAAESEQENNELKTATIPPDIKGLLGGIGKGGRK